MFTYRSVGFLKVPCGRKLFWMSIKDDKLEQAITIGRFKAVETTVKSKCHMQ